MVSLYQAARKSPRAYTMVICIPQTLFINRRSFASFMKCVAFSYAWKHGKSKGCYGHLKCPVFIFHLIHTFVNILICIFNY